MKNNDVRYVVGFIMFVGGLYLLLQEIKVFSGIGMGIRGGGLYNMGGYSITSGYIIIVFMFGVGMLFFNSKNPIGWVIAVGAVIALVFGVIANAQFTLAGVSSFDLLVIMILLCGGLGLLLSGMLGRNRD